MMKRGFTLIELLVVMGIMGLMGTVAVGGYRAMQRGMEERGVVQNVNAFIRSAYQRAVMDRQPVNVYFWNETIRDESDVDTLIVVGRAVAVRRGGRITMKTTSNSGGELLIDEFADLRFSRLIADEDDESDEESGTRSGKDVGNGMYLYRLAGANGGLQRSIVSRLTERLKSSPNERMITTGGLLDVHPYGYTIIDSGSASNWQVGDAYGFEIAEIQLPENYIFRSTYSSSTQNPVAGETLMRFGADGSASSDTIQISSLRPDKSGNISAQTIATTDKPSQDMQY